MLLFKELKDCLFWLLTILIMVVKNLKETVIEKYFLPRVKSKIATGQRDAYTTRLSILQRS